MALYGSSPDIPHYADKAQIVFTDSTGRVVGGSVPISVEHRVTLIGSPNEFAHQRLMQAVNNIVPEAAAPPSTEGMDQVGTYKGVPVWADREFPPPCDGHHATEAPMPPHLAERLDGKDDDEGEAIKWGGTD